MSAKPFPLSQLDTMMDSQNLGAIQGVLKTIHEPKVGTNSIGKYHLQNGELESDGVVVPITLSDRDPLDLSLRGRTLFFHASDNGKGISIWDQNRNGAAVRKIKIGKGAVMDIIDGGGRQQSAAPTGQQNRQAAQHTGQTSLQDPPERTQGQTPPRERQSPPKNREESREEKISEQRSLIKETKRELLQLANLKLLCDKMVSDYMAPRFKELTGQPMPEAQRQAVSTSLFIKGERDGHYRRMPMGDIMPFLTEEE